MFMRNTATEEKRSRSKNRITKLKNGFVMYVQVLILATNSYVCLRNFEDS